MALNQVGLERLNTATTKKIGTNKNLIINGATLVAQRGTSSTSTGYQTVDRFFTSASGLTLTTTQHDLSSSDTPYASGFRKSYHIQNTSVGSNNATNVAGIRYLIEAQDIANSGWNYTSTSSYITFSFWVKVSLAGTYYVQLRTKDGTNKVYAFPFTVSADTWLKVEKSIPGDSSLVINNDNGAGLDINIYAFYGTDGTDSGFTLNSWATFSSSSRTPDFAQNFNTTNNATFELTGVQLEVGSVATDFEHRSFADEERLCKRYFQRFTKATHSQTPFIGHITSAVGIIGHVFSQVMRDTPSVSYANNFNVYTASTNNVKTNLGIEAAPQGFRTLITSMTGTNGHACQIDFENNTLLDFSAEL